MGAMAMGGAEEDFRWQTAGSGINPVAMDKAVVGATTAKRTTAPMKRDDAMKGSWSGAVDERRPSLAVDDGVGVAAPARWRMGWRAEDADRSGEVVVAPTVYEWGNGGGGDLKLWDEFF